MKLKEIEKVVLPDEPSFECHLPRCGLAAAMWAAPNCRPFPHCRKHSGRKGTTDRSKEKDLDAVAPEQEESLSGKVLLCESVSLGLREGWLLVQSLRTGRNNANSSPEPSSS